MNNMNNPRDPNRYSANGDAIENLICRDREALRAMPDSPKERIDLKVELPLLAAKTVKVGYMNDLQVEEKAIIWRQLHTLADFRPDWARAALEVIDGEPAS